MFNTRQTYVKRNYYSWKIEQSCFHRKKQSTHDRSPEDRVTHVTLYVTKFTIAPNFEIEGAVNARTRGPLEIHLFRDRCQHDRQI